MAAKQGSVRIGPVSILVLIITLCLAVMAVLALTTAEAQRAITDREASSTTALYANETEGQTLLANLDASLAVARANGQSVSWAINNLDLPEGWTYENGILSVEFVQENGRKLDIQLEVPNLQGYRVLSWKASTEWTEEDPNQFLWTFSGWNDEEQ